MKLLRRVALDWAELDEIDPRILIQGVEPSAGKDQIQSVSLWGGTGSRVTGEHRDTLDVSVKFSMDIKRGQYQERSEVFERVMAWANKGGWLTLSQKPGRRIRVIAAQLPSEGDPLEWTNRYTITFRAYGVPYWQSITPAKAAASGSTASMAVSVTGSVPTTADVEFQNTSGSEISTADITAGTTAIHLTGLGLANNEILMIDHPDDGRRCLLRIRIRSTAGVWRTVLDKRTPASSDDLILNPGRQTITLTAGGSGVWGVKWWERYV